MCCNFQYIYTTLVKLNNTYYYILINLGLFNPIIIKVLKINMTKTDMLTIGSEQTSKTNGFF